MDLSLVVVKAGVEDDGAVAGEDGDGAGPSTVYVEGFGGEDGVG